MVERIKIGHDQHQVACFLHWQKSRPVGIEMCGGVGGDSEEGGGGGGGGKGGDGKLKNHLGTLSPMALSKHYMAAPMAVTNW